MQFQNNIFLITLFSLTKDPPKAFVFKDTYVYNCLIVLNLVYYSANSNGFTQTEETVLLNIICHLCLHMYA